MGRRLGYAPGYRPENLGVGMAITGIEKILFARIEDAPAVFSQHPALVWELEKFAQDTAADVTPYPGGMGITLPPIPSSGIRFFLQKLNYVYDEAIYKHWRDLDVTHIQSQQTMFRALNIFMALDPGPRLMQAQFDFLTLRDQSAQINILQPVAEEVLEADQSITFTNLRHIWNEADEDLIRLVGAFKRQMITDAGPAPKVHGNYVMQREPLDVVDAHILYETLRLIFTPQGIFCSVIFQDQYITFFWSPTGINTAQVYLRPLSVDVIDALMACIWRDACRAETRFTTERTGHRGYKRPRPDTAKDPKLMLPKIIYRSIWGSESDRATISDIVRQAHHVTGAYPLLPEGHQPRDAVERALEHGWPPPPEGHTFRKPHTRGLGEPTQKPREIVCRGLQVAKLILN